MQVLYSLGEIEIGANAVVSQRTYLCAASHDYTQPGFPIYAKKVCIGAQAWLATDVFVAPGVTVGEGAVVGARSSVFHDLPPMILENAVGAPQMLRYAHETALLSTNGAVTNLVRVRST